MRSPGTASDLASYYFAISPYYQALVEPPCSPTALQALEKAAGDLDEYIGDHDGQLLGIYAQDIQGLVWWERAKCAEDPEKKEAAFNKAFERFETCIYTDDDGPEYLRVITRGYYHAAQTGMDAGRMQNRNFARDALTHLEQMLTRNPTAWRTEDGLRALVEWSKLECGRGNANRAVEVAKDAGERAKLAGYPGIERAANRQLNDYVGGGCGGSVGGLDPEVLKRVADDLFQRQQYAEAIRAYRTVVNSTSNGSEDFLAFRWHAWERIAQCYKNLGDRLGEALAYEPIHDTWMRGDIPSEKVGDENPNPKRAGDDRRIAARAFQDLANLTGSPVFRARASQIAETFGKDYADHCRRGRSDWNMALEKWRLAEEQKARNDPAWGRTLAQARTLFGKVAGDPRHEKHESAWVYLLRCDLNEEKYAEAVAVADRAFQSWSTPERQEEEQKFTTVQQRRDTARGMITYWKARAQHETKQPEAVLATLQGYHDKWPGLDEVYLSLAYDLLTRSYLALGRVDEAGEQYRTLLRRFPKYGGVSSLTFLLAGHFDAQRAVIEKRLREVTGTFFEKRRAYREADREAFRLGGLIADLKNQRNKAERAIDTYAEETAEGKKPSERSVGEALHREKKAELATLEGSGSPRRRGPWPEWRPRRDALEKSRSGRSGEQRRGSASRSTSRWSGPPATTRSGTTC